MSYYEMVISMISEAEKYLLQNGRNSQIKFYYRGHRDLDWELIPTIVRCRHPEMTEKSQIQNAISYGRWNLGSSLFENIACLQHYGYMTRFLDYTTSVDVALYFACQRNEPEVEKDGVISLCCYSNDRNVLTLDSALISEIALLTTEVNVMDFATEFIARHGELIETYCKNQAVANQKTTNISCEDIAMTVLSWCNHGFMVTPTQKDMERMQEVNPRIVRQKGAFFVFGNETNPPLVEATTSAARIATILPKISSAPICIRPDIYKYGAVNILIRKDWKEDILNELARKGITKRYLFPDDE